MTTKPKVKNFRIRRGERTVQTPAPKEPDADAEIAKIQGEGLTARQLRMARRVAQKNGLTVTSDHDAVYQLRQAGIDPFQKNSVLELVTPNSKKLPQTTNKQQLPAKAPNPTMNERASEIRKIQRDIVRRRRRKLALLFTRLAFFVFLPTAFVGWYYYTTATPMYATNSEVVIQQAAPEGGASGLGSLFQGTSIATQQDSIAVQSYLASREAMLRLDAEYGFRDHFSDPVIDDIQRLDADATNEGMFKLYTKRVRISYDPTEGILRMEVIAADPQKSQDFAQALLGYAEEQVDQLTARLRADQMQGARDSYEAAELRRTAALDDWLSLQEELQQLDTVGETSARTTQIATQESERQRLQLILRSRLNVPRPNQAQVNALRDQIANIDRLIDDLRQQMTSPTGETASLAARNTRLRLAEENYTFQTIIVQQALTQMEAAQIEANKQVRYLSQSVKPIAPDEATYPRAFENTLLAFLIFSGIYLMISLTAAILREQVTA